MGEEKCCSGLLEEEESQLQCSLPLYLDNVFGDQTYTSMLCSQRCEVKSYTDKHFKLASPDCCMGHHTQVAHSTSTAGTGKPYSDSTSIDPHASKQALALEGRQNTEVPGIYPPSLVPVVEPYVCPQGCTVLSACANVDAGKLINLLCTVMQVNPVTEVECKSGFLAGSTVSMSSMLLGDPTKSYFKLTLWREASSWIERIVSGDILFLTDIRLKVWKGEPVGHTVMRSSILNLHWPKGTLPTRLQSTISQLSLKTLQHWAQKTHWYLFQKPALQPNARVCFVTSEQLGTTDAIFNFRGKFLGILSTSVIVVGDYPGRDLHMYIVGDKHREWLKQLGQGIGSVYEFLNITAIQENTQDGFSSLQTTTYSKLRILPSDCGPAVDILKRYSDSAGGGGDSMVHPSCSFRKILEQKRSGRFQCCAKLQSMKFIISDDVFVPVKQSSSSADLITQLHSAVYVGCDSCYRALIQDLNGIYCSCKYCTYKYPRANLQSCYFFRPLLLTLLDDSGEVDVFVPHALVPQVLDNISATSVAKAKLSGDLQLISGLHDTVMAVMAAYAATCGWTLNCVIKSDDNSFVEYFLFSLLDCKVHVSEK